MYFITVITTHKSVKTTVIPSLKHHFHKLVLLRMIECIDKKEVYSVNLIDVVHKAWECITEKTIQNCFWSCKDYSGGGIDRNHMQRSHHGTR